jgi:hypothetical protein
LLSRTFSRISSSGFITISNFGLANFPVTYCGLKIITSLALRFPDFQRKKIWGNPYIRKERIKGIGEVTSLMTKASGQLEINLDVSREKAKEIKSMIENAGVSSFYLGKKGLAYISQEIDTRELKQ